MAIDDTKVAYNSNWDIDQVAFSGTANATITGTTFPTTSIHNIFDYPAGFTSSLGGAPIVEAQWRTGGGDWQDFGDSFFIETNTTRFWIRGARWSLGDLSIEVRYWVMNDKVSN